MNTKITINTVVASPIEKVWAFYTEPEHIVHWNFATDDWQCPSAENDLKAGGTYKARMEAKDGSFGFDFEAIYIEVEPLKKLVYRLGDDRKVQIDFIGNNHETEIIIVFDAEAQNSIEMQQQGWQAILNNFKRYVEDKSKS